FPPQNLDVDQQITQTKRFVSRSLIFAKRQAAHHAKRKLKSAFCLNPAKDFDLHYGCYTII
ncbi:MAG: hypothetical protein KDE54_00865, partial [Caldilineaceae bacterium]|nr:hypothetical protein [Caldilineaceae bacterium]